MLTVPEIFANGKVSERSNFFRDLATSWLALEEEVTNLMEEYLETW